MKLGILSYAILTIINGTRASGFFFTPSRSKTHNVINVPSNRAPFPRFPRQMRTTVFQKTNNSSNSIAGSSTGLLIRRNVLKVITGAAIGIPILLEVYARSGRVQTYMNIFEAEVVPGSAAPNGPLSGIDSDVRDITIIFHGAGGQDENTDNLLKVLSSKLDNAATRTPRMKGIVKMVDWSADSADILQASVKGSKIGSQIGHLVRDVVIQQRNAGNNERNIHIIGISVGAFAANSLVQTLDSELDRTTRKNTNLQLTLLDPFQQKAVLGLNYGNRHFGQGADYAQHYLNTDDPVPSTNDPLQYCSTVDVTSLRPTEVFGHDWPLVYYTQKLKESGENGIVPPERRGKIGSLKVL
jgi:hypothetical protein